MIPEGEEKTTSKLSIGLIVLSFFLLLILILVVTGYYKKAISFINPDIENCKGGSCQNTCMAGTEIEARNVKCSNPSKVCCLLNNRTASPECAGKSKGDVCGTLMLCDDYNVCVTRCEYCAINPNDTKCGVSDLSGKIVDALDSSFSCGCSESQCIEFDSSKLGTCVKGFCPSEDTVGTGRMCCSSPYK